MQKKKTAHHGRICSWQRLWSRVLVLILLAATMISVLQPQRAQAVEVNGQAGGSIPGASNTNVTGGYAIRSTTIPLGFRFTVVTEDGTEKGAPKDIYANAQLSDMISGGYKTYGILDAKRSKMDYVALYRSSSTKYNYTNVTLSSASGIASSSAGRYLDTNLGLTLPTSASSMVNTWSQNEENIDKVLEALWNMDIVSDWAANDYHLAVEPLYAVKIGGQYFPLTVTEAVIYSVLDSTAYSTANGRWDGTTAGLWTAVPDYTSDNGTTWQTISGYTHGAWPESMKLEEAVFGLSDPSTTLSTSSRGSAKNIIEKGYGIIDVSKEYLPGISTPTTYTNTIAFYAGEFKNQEGNSSTKNWLHLGDTTFTAAAGSSVTMTTSQSITVPNGHYLMTDFGTSGLSGSWTRYNFPYTFTQPSKNLWIEYDFAALSYSITYNLNGGTNNSSNPSSYKIHYGVSLKNPTRTGYTFTGWTAQTASQTVTLAADSSNYHYTSILRNLEPGTTYTLNIGTAKVTSGSSSAFSVKIYDFTANTTLATKDDISFGSNVSVSMTCPSSANSSHDIRMIIYSGKSGSTANVATNFSSLTISYPCTGINAGEDLEFVRTDTSKDTFYSKMDARQTGSLTLTANWSENRLIVNYYSNYATEACSDSLNTVGADKNVHVKTINYYYDNVYNVSLQDYTYSSANCYLGRTGYTGTGYWGTSTTGGTLVSQETTFTTGQALAELFGKSLASGTVTINIYPQWEKNAAKSITFNYYSNYADTLKGGAIDSSSQVFVVSWTVTSEDSFPTSHWDYTPDVAAYYMTRKGYTATGYWGTSPSGGTLVEQNYGFQSYADLCSKHGVSVDAESTTINLYAQWTPNTIKVTLNAMGGSGHSPTVFYFKYGTNTLYSNSACTSKISKFTVPTRSGYTLNHFYGDGTSGGNNAERYIYSDGTWASDLVTDIYKDATLYASWSENETYTITWENWDGTVLETDTNVEAGTTPTYNGSTPTRPSTVYYNYTFKGWTPTVSTVTGDTTYTATYTATARLYYQSVYIRFEDVDGTWGPYELVSAASGNYTYGSTYPGWSETYDYPYADDANVGSYTVTRAYATYVDISRARYTVKTVAGTGISSTNHSSATEYIAGSTVTINATVASNYTWGSWTGTFNTTTKQYSFTVTQDVTVTANAAANTFTVTWKNWNGTVLETDNNVAYGTTPSYNSSTPTKSRTGYTCTFDGWTPTIAPVTGNVTYTATFTETPIQYTITYDENGGTSVADQSYTITTNLTLRAAPTRTGYTFTGWKLSTSYSIGSWSPTTYSASLNRGTGNYGNVTLIAQWTVKTYTVTWVNHDGTVLETDTGVSYGATPSYNGTTPTRAASGNYTYTFAGWTPTISTVTGDVTYTATFTEVPNVYTITCSKQSGTGGTTYFYEVYNTKFYTNTSTKASVTAISVPTRTGYTFGGYYTGLNGSGTRIVTSAGAIAVSNYYFTANATIYAYWVPKTFTVTWANEDGTVLETDTGVAYGTTPTYNSTTPTKASTAQYSYSFSGWTPTVSAVTGDITYYAQFTATTRGYTVTWKNGTTTLETDTNVAYGATPSYDGNTPTRASTAQYSYTFNGWNPSVSPVTGDITYYAQFTATTRKYTVTWKNDNGTVLETDTNVPYGTTPTYDGTTPSKSVTGYTCTFDDWTPEISPVTGNVTYTATYTLTPISYKVTYDENGGTSVADQNYTIETNLTLRAAPTRTGYTFTGWKLSTSYAIGSWSPTTYSASQNRGTGNYGNVTLIAQWTVKTYTVTWVNHDGTVLETDTNVTYGTTPTYNGSTPVKTIPGYVSVFDGWSPEISPVTGNVTYTAQFIDTNKPVYQNYIEHHLWNPVTGQYEDTGDRTYFNGVEGETTMIPTSHIKAYEGYNNTGKAGIDWGSGVTEERNIGSTFTQPTKAVRFVYYYRPQTFTVTWENWDDTVLETDTDVPYGTTPSYNGTMPTKPSTTTKTYTFSGWSPEISPVTGDITYTAQFTEEARKYTQTVNVRYQNVDGSWGDYTLVESKDYAYGSTHSGWSVAKSYPYEAASLSGYTVTGAKNNYISVYRQKFTVTTTAGTGISSTSGDGTYYAGATATIDATVSSGYEWSDWSGTFSTTTKNYSFTVTQDVTVTATASQGTFTITYMYGTTVLGIQQYDKKESFNLREAYNKAGYTFQYWALSTAVGNWTPGSYNANQSMPVGKTGNVTLYAVLNRISYQINYVDTDGTVLFPAQTYTIEDAVTLAETSSKSGYKFTGWKLETAVGNWTAQTYAANQSFVAGKYGTITLVAQWDKVKTYIVVYEPNGGDGDMDDDIHIIGEPSNLSPNEFVKPGYEFDGWNTEEDGSGDSYEDGEEVQDMTTEDGGEVKLHAQWKPIQYTITYNENGGTSVADLSYTVEDPVVLAVAPSRIGYNFGGWKLASAPADGNWAVGTCSAKQSFAAGKYGNIVLVAQWTKIAYTITYDTDGGSAVESQTYYVDTNVTLAGAPTKNGYTFGGWELEVPVGNWPAGTYEAGQNVGANKQGNITLKAKWEPKYDVALSQILLSYSTADNAMSASERANIMAGKTVYVYYVLTNNSPVATNVTAYDKNGNEISHNGSTSYRIAGNGGTLTIRAGSFVASTPGSAAYSGSVYMTGYTDASPEMDDGSNNVNSTSYTVKLDLAVKEIYLTDADGVRLGAAAVPLDSEVKVHVVYENKSNMAFTVNGYYNDGKISYNGSQNFSIGAGSTIDVVVAVLTTPSEEGSHTVTAAIYRNGKTAATEKNETTLANNTLTLTYTVSEEVILPTLEPIDPNASYREGTEVITSYWLHNAGRNNYTSSKYITVRLKAYDETTGELLYEKTQKVVVPAGETQLVYFRWTVPTGLSCSQIRAVADMKLYGSTEYFGAEEFLHSYAKWEVNYTPDTKYEPNAPDYWERPEKPSTSNATATWYEWVYKNGAFSKVSYGITAQAGAAVPEPYSETAYQENGKWFMKSGYGFYIVGGHAVISQLSGYNMPSYDAFTNAQYVYMTFPEFDYSQEKAYQTTLELVNGVWQFYPFLDYGRLHFTPIWYPDGYYHAKYIQTDIWTPMGVLTVSRATVDMTIEGDMYDDWWTN